MSRLLAMQVFERVADEGGFAAAGRALDISPPVVTRLIAELETHLGTRLFQRTTRRVSLTEAGEAYLKRVRQILQDIQDADAIAHAHTNDLAGRLRVHTPPALSTYVIAPLLAAFRQRYPDILITIEVEALDIPSIEDYDVTLFGTNTHFDADIVARKVIESEIILIASPAYIQRHGQPRQPHDLLKHDCLRLKWPDRPLQPWRLWCPTHPEHTVEIDVGSEVVVNHTETLLRAALDGAGIMAVTIDVVAPHLVRGELVRVLSPWITGHIQMYAALPSRKFIPKRTRVFLEFLTEWTREQNQKALEACKWEGGHGFLL